MSRRYKLKFNDAPGASTTNVTYNGITWTLSGSPTVGTFVLGDPYVVGPVTVLSVSPAWSSPYNGAMVNPSATSPQGYDAQTNPFANTYSAGVRTTFPYSMTAGQSLISVESRQPYKSGGAYQSMKKTAVLTCLASAPAANTFRPAYAGSTKTLWNTSDINYGLLPDYANPSGQTIPLLGTTPADNLTFTPALGYCDYGDDPNNVGRYRSFDAMKYPWISHGSRIFNAAMHAEDQSDPYYFSDAINRMAAKILIDHSEKNETLHRLIQFGIDAYAVSQFNLDGWNAIGGYGKSRKFCIVLAGIMFNDTGMKSPTATVNSTVSGNPIKKFHEDGMTYYGTDGVTALYGEDVPDAEGESEPPANTNSGKRDPAGVLDAFEGLLTNRGSYHQINSRAFIGQALAAQKITGMKTAWGHNPFFDYCDRWVNSLSAYWTGSGSTLTNDLYGYGGTGNGWLKAVWDTYR